MSSHTQTKQIPRDAAVMHAILKEMGVKLYEPRVVNQMLEYVYRYVTGVVEEARVYSTYAKKKTVDMDDIRLAIKMLTEKSVTSVPPREVLMKNYTNILMNFIFVDFWCFGLSSICIFGNMMNVIY